MTANGGAAVQTGFNPQIIKPEARLLRHGHIPQFGAPIVICDI
jgi:hypothetical protein